MTNWIGLVALSFYVFGVIGVAELCRKRGMSRYMTRKIVHIGVGMMIWIVPFVIQNRWYFIGTALAFSLLTLADNRLNFFKSVSQKGELNLGTFYFPIAAAVIAYVFWDRPALMVAAIMPLTWGDGMAEVIGRSFGKHHYTIFSHTRSIEGTFAFILFGFVFTWLALWTIFSPPLIGWESAVLPALITIFATAAIEAISVFGLDNLLVTFTAGVILHNWPF